MKVLRAFFTVFLCFSMVCLLNAQLSKRSGNILGTVTDDQGSPLPGTSISVQGPNLQGTMTDVTRSDGTYRIPGLPPGIYSAVAKLPGFQTVTKEGIIIHIGVTVEIDFQIKQSGLEEQITVTAQTPTVDVKSNKTALVLDSTAMAKLPLNRSLWSIVAAAPGAYQSGTIAGASNEFIVHGGTGISQTVDVDGVNANWAADYGVWFGDISYDSMDEVEIITAGIPAEDTVPGGALINVVTKSGGNSFHGQLQAYYTGQKVTQQLFAKEYLKSLGLSPTALDTYNVEPSFSLGGPIIKDRVWFFTDLGYQKFERWRGFIPTTIDDVSYEDYKYWRDYTKGFLKLSIRFTDNLRGFVMGSYIKYRDPASGGSVRTLPSAIDDYWDTRMKLNSSFTWYASKNTFVDIRAGLSATEDMIIAQEGAENSPNYYDYYTGYDWGTPGRQRHSFTKNLQGNLNVTHFEENLLGASHEFKAGVLYQHVFYKWPWFRQDPRDIHVYNGNIYYWRGYYGIPGPDPVYGDGRFNIRYCAPNDGESYSRGDMVRLGGFIQDSLTIKERLTLNLGVRYDYYVGYCPAADKAASAPLAEAIGEYALTPLFGFNALGAMHMDKWSDILKWNTFSPRFGFIYDLFGNGKTALKGSFSVYTDFMSTMYFDTSHPFREWSIAFNWWDTNGDGIMDLPPIDDYKYYDLSKNPAEMDPSFFKLTVDPETKSPLYWEYTLGVDHQFFNDFSVGLKYIYKKKTNTVDTVYWDPETEDYWYTYEGAPDWWVPFTTIVPAVDNFPEQEVTMYFPSTGSPTSFRRFTNVPEAKRNYHGIQLTFDKRMSKGWSLGGSVVIARTRGNNAGAYGSVWGYSGAYDQANWWVNRYGRTSEDLPYMAKLYGAFTLPYGFLFSFSGHYQAGGAWQRTVSVTPPQAWCTANNALRYSYTINVEPQGSRRNPDEGWVDIRFEKEFSLGKVGKVGFFVDVLNLLGYRMLFVNYNPGGTWRPTDENVTTGTFTRSSTYGRATGSTGQRYFKFSIRFTF